MEVTTAMLPTTTPPSLTPMLRTPTDTPMLTTACPMLTTAKGLLMPTNLGHPMHPKRERPSLSLRPLPMLRLTPRLIPGSTTPESGEGTTAMLPTTTPLSLTPMLPTPTDTPMLTTAFPMLTTANSISIVQISVFMFNKSSYFRVKLKRIKFELYTEP